MMSLGVPGQPMGNTDGAVNDHDGGCKCKHPIEHTQQVPLSSKPLGRPLSQREARAMRSQRAILDHQRRNRSRASHHSISSAKFSLGSINDSSSSRNQIKTEPHVNSVFANNVKLRGISPPRTAVAQPLTTKDSADQIAAKFLKPALGMNVGLQPRIGGRKPGVNDVLKRYTNIINGPLPPLRPKTGNASPNK